MSDTHEHDESVEAKYHEHPPSVNAQSFKTAGLPGSGSLTFLCAALTGAFMGCIARAVHNAYHHMAEWKFDLMHEALGEDAEETSAQVLATYGVCAGLVSDSLIFNPRLLVVNFAEFIILPGSCVRCGRSCVRTLRQDRTGIWAPGDHRGAQRHLRPSCRCHEIPGLHDSRPRLFDREWSCSRAGK